MLARKLLECKEEKQLEFRIRSVLSCCEHLKIKHTILVKVDLISRLLLLRHGFGYFNLYQNLNTQDRFGNTNLRNEITYLLNIPCYIEMAGIFVSIDLP